MKDLAHPVLVRSCVDCEDQKWDNGGQQDTFVNFSWRSLHYWTQPLSLHCVLRPPGSEIWLYMSLPRVLTLKPSHLSLMIQTNVQFVVEQKEVFYKPQVLQIRTPETKFTCVSNLIFSFLQVCFTSLPPNVSVLYRWDE